MDDITALAFSIQNPLLSTIGHTLDNDMIFVIVILALVLIGEWRNEKRAKIFASLAVAFVLGLAIKQFVAEPRPCIGLDGCPSDYAFPSLHALIAFTLMTGFLSKKSFPFFLLFALFVSFTRLNIGVHSFMDIAGALPIALIVYYITDIASRRIEIVSNSKHLPVAKRSRIVAPKEVENGS